MFRESKLCLQKSKNTSIDENSHIWMKIHKSGKINLDGRRAYMEKIITCKISKNVSWGTDHEFQVEEWGYLGKPMKPPEHGKQNLFS